jgi:excisionase family DNA binding protein
MDATMPPEVMKAPELAKYLGVELFTVYKMANPRRTNPLPGRKVGKEYRFLKSAVDRWLGK